MQLINIIIILSFVDLSLFIVLLMLTLIIILKLSRIYLIRIRIHHAGDLFCQLQQVDTVFRVRVDNLVTFYVFKIIHQYILAEHINESLDVGGHFLFVIGLDELAEIVIREGRHKELNVKLISVGRKRLLLGLLLKFLRITHLKKTEGSSIGSSKPMFAQIWLPKSKIVAITKSKFE